MATNKKGKGKVSKNQKGGKTNFVPEKRIKPKKEYIYIEQTQENIDKITTVEEGIKSYYEGKPIVSILTKYGKRYYKVKNEVEEEISSI